MPPLNLAFNISPQINQPLDSRLLGTYNDRPQGTQLFEGLLRYETGSSTSQQDAATGEVTVTQHDAGFYYYDGTEWKSLSSIFSGADTISLNPSDTTPSGIISLNPSGTEAASTGSTGFFGFVDLEHSNAGLDYPISVFVSNEQGLNIHSSTDLPAGTYDYFEVAAGARQTFFTLLFTLGGRPDPATGDLLYPPDGTTVSVMIVPFNELQPDGQVVSVVGATVEVADAAAFGWTPGLAFTVTPDPANWDGGNFHVRFHLI